MIAPVAENKLRIGFLEPHLKCFGGIRRILEFSNRLVQRGHEVTIFLPAGEVMGCGWMRCDARVVAIQGNERAELDVLVFNHEPQWHLMPRFLHARARVFYALHHAALYDKGGAYESARFPVHRLLANSHWTAEMIARETGVHGQVVLGGIDRHLFHPVAAAKRYDVLHYGDRRRPWKGTADVEAACRLIGVRPVGYDGRGLKQRQMAREYGRARVFVSGSWFEGFCQPGLEALACGTPLVTTDSGGCREYAIHEETALVVPPRDPRALADAIQRMLADAALASRLRHNGLKLVEQKFTWELATDRLEQELHRAVEAARRPEPPAARWFIDQRRAQLAQAPPKLSIVAPVWNQLHFTQAFVESIRRHTTVPYELILVDNGSQELAQDYVERAADVAITNADNLGFAHAMNQGLERARGAVVAFMNNDTQVAAGWSEQLIATLESDRNAGIVVPAVTAAGNPVSVRSAPGEMVVRLPLFADPPSAVVYVMRTDVARRLHGFSEEYPVASAEDVDLCFQVWANGLDILVDERVLVRHEGKGTARVLADYRQLWKQNRKLFLHKWTSGAPSVEYLGHVVREDFDRLRQAAAGAAAWMSRYFAKRDEFEEYRERKHRKRKHTSTARSSTLRRDQDGRRRWLDKKWTSLKRRVWEPFERLWKRDGSRT
ncbi:MAG: glycosyltransferase [Planctomycetota bacterium]